MPWKECKPMDQRIRFIARLLEGEKMAPLCREFGNSRVTGYKIFNRYKAKGSPLVGAHEPNGLWCAGYPFRDRARCPRRTRTGQSLRE